MRVENEGSRAFAPVQPVQDAVQKTRFAGAGLAGEDQKALSVLNTKHEPGQSCFMRRGGVVETRIGGNMEGILPQAHEVEELFIHHILPLSTRDNGWNCRKRKG